MNDHWLKERYKDYTTEELEVAQIFIETTAEYSNVEDELQRREQENESTHLSGNE